MAKQQTITAYHKMMPEEIADSFPPLSHVRVDWDPEWIREDRPMALQFRLDVFPQRVDSYLYPINRSENARAARMHGEKRETHGLGALKNANHLFMRQLPEALLNALMPHMPDEIREAMQGIIEESARYRNGLGKEPYVSQRNLLADECYVGDHDMRLDANHFHFHFWRRIGRDFYEQQVDADRVERAIGQLREWFRLPEHEDAIISLEVPTQAGMERLDVARSQLIRLFCAALMGLTIHATNIYPEPVLDFMHEVQPTPAIAILNTGVWPVLALSENPPLNDEGEPFYWPLVNRMLQTVTQNVDYLLFYASYGFGQEAEVRKLFAETGLSLRQEACKLLESIDHGEEPRVREDLTDIGWAHFVEALQEMGGVNHPWA